ncbi:MAG: lysine--tRNA ligase [Candidatus Niyogibacteria bacterium CG10_big_fil_rev_8_21_14_0_10_42_19]|uniref:Lysine--tRNA ligase n=1 Tax=Candidatus Niyogibacteria bacterium CG10_big_fil_rev_8_21_14_0_10_42_19 TaxID=1974725 RepID=A0A2H0TGK1_9BACT|nr:MAG: lysine--tRNA ligase [Candidatus Niyogibacteria bacterium CG10_big_fil_rev_8_21_14_0_10_42_19]
MSSLEEIRQNRLEKLKDFKDKKIDPYPAVSGRTFLIQEVADKFASLEKGKKKVVISGRIMAKREHGKSTFIDIEDGGAKIQVYFKKDILGDDYDLFGSNADIGDFIEVEGICFKTKKNENTIEVLRWSMLSKSVRPLPEKWHGLQDVEERFRKRYLDLVMNKDIRSRFLKRNEIIKELRAFLGSNDFFEVETPMLQHIPGGALAKPFITHHNALDIDLYLRIAPELYLKRLLVGGFERIYEIGKCFRNEGIDASHNPEFTMMECYAAYWDENDMMDFVEKMFLAFAKKFGLKNEVEYEGKKILFKKGFLRIKFKDVLKQYALIGDYEAETRDSLAARARQLGIDTAPRESKGKIADEIYKKVCRVHLVQPTFIVDHPLDISPLAKKKNSNEARRFQLIVAGLEVANGFSELNDPIDQRGRFEEQEKERVGGEEEAHRTDEDYLEAMEYGMPPAAGLGVGIDRLVMFLTDVKNVREVFLFPTMRPK